MAKMYDSCDFIFSLENVDLDGVSSDSIYFLKNNVSRISATVLVDEDSEVVHIKPNALLEEHIEYKIVFSDALCFENGHRFSRSFCIRFRIKDGAAFSPNSIDSDSDYFSPKNRLRFSLLISVYFDESVNAPEELSFKTLELPDFSSLKSHKLLSGIKRNVSAKANASIILSVLLFIVVLILYTLY